MTTGTLKYKVGDRVRYRTYGRNVKEYTEHNDTIVALVGPAWGYLVQRDGEAELVRHVSEGNVLGRSKTEPEPEPEPEPGTDKYRYLEKGGII